MKNRILLAMLAVAALVYVPAAGLQAQGRYVDVQVAADHQGWVYNTGEKVQFQIAVTKNYNPIPGVKIRYELSEDYMPPFKTEEVVLRDGTLTVDAGTLRNPGFIRCQVTAEYDGAVYRNLATAAFEPEKIRPVTTEPADFRAFWEKAVEQNRRLDLDPQMELLAERSTGDMNVYQINFQNYRRGARVYGILCVPKAPGKYPAILTVPGAGIRAYNGDTANAERGYITLEIGIHGIPVNLPAHIYSELSAGGLSNYWDIRLDDKDNYFYKRVILGCLRAVDFIYTLPQFDGETLAVRGQSQGGALTIITTSLDSRVKAFAAYHPALSDLTGYLHGRAGGWPNFFRGNPAAATPQKLETVGYYDAVNFARYIKVPGWLTFGFNDMTVSPTSMYAVYNTISSPKELFLVEDIGHTVYPEQRRKEYEWLDKMLK